MLITLKLELNQATDMIHDLLTLIVPAQPPCGIRSKHKQAVVFACHPHQGLYTEGQFAKKQSSPHDLF